MQTASEASSPVGLLDDTAAAAAETTTSRSDEMTSSPTRCHGDCIDAPADSVQSPSADRTPTESGPRTAVTGPCSGLTGPCTAITGPCSTVTGPRAVVTRPYLAVTGPCTVVTVPSVTVPLAVLDEFSVGGATDTEDPGTGPGDSSSARRRRSQFGGSRRSGARPATTSNGPVVSPTAPGEPSAPPGAVVVDMNSNDKDEVWDRTLDDEEGDTLRSGDDLGSYDADDAMVEFAERYFNAQPAQFSHSAIARTVNIVTRKSLNVSILGVVVARIFVTACHYIALLHYIRTLLMA